MEITDAKVIAERLSKVRDIMKTECVDIYVVVTGDYHISEYAGDYFKEREFITGFTGSAGTAVITITPTDVTSYDGNTITGNKTVTITVNSKPTSNPNNGGNKTGTTTTPKPTKKKSSNNNLSSLTIEDYNLDKEFKKEVTEYTVVVQN